MACLFLNYVFFDKYHIKKLTDVKANMVKDFLNDYGLCNLPGDNEKELIEEKKLLIFA